jgi:hypothetical protein
MTFPRLAVVAASGAATILLPILAWATSSQHRVLVTFDYDFTFERPCKDNETGTCVKQFIIYDITGPNAPVKLFSIATNPKVKKKRYQIKVKSNLLELTDGMRTFAATAQRQNGEESDPHVCSTTVEVKPQQAQLDLKMKRESGM